MDIVKLFKKINTYGAINNPSPHKPVLLLPVLMHYYNNEDRMILFSDLDNEFRRFFLKYRIKGKLENSHYPFGKLENDGCWEVADSNKLKRTSVGHLSKKELLEKRVRGGVIKEVYLYLMDDKFLLLSILDSPCKSMQVVFFRNF